MLAQVLPRREWNEAIRTLDKLNAEYLFTVSAGPRGIDEHVCLIRDRHSSSEWTRGTGSDRVVAFRDAMSKLGALTHPRSRGEIRALENENERLRARLDALQN